MTSLKTRHRRPHSGRRPKVLDGRINALTNRVNSTAGLEVTKPGLEFLIERDRSREATYYQMLADTREVIETLRLLLDDMARPVGEIRTKFEDEASWLGLMRGSLSGVRSRVDRLALKLVTPQAAGCASCRGQEDTPKVVCVYGDEVPDIPPETRCETCGAWFHSGT